MRKLFLILVLSIFSTLAVNAQLSTKIGKVSGAYNFWLYEPENVSSSTNSTNSSTDDNSDPNFNPPPTDESGEEYLPIMLESESAEVQIAKELSEKMDSCSVPDMPPSLPAHWVYIFPPGPCPQSSRRRYAG